MSNDPYDHIRAVCLALPEATEKLTHGGAGFFIRGKKQFVFCANNHHGDGRIAIWCACEKDMQRVLVAEEPAHYFVPPYVGVRGWVGVKLNSGLPHETIEALIEDAYALVAPPKLLAQLNNRR